MFSKLGDLLVDISADMFFLCLTILYLVSKAFSSSYQFKLLRYDNQNDLKFPRERSVAASSFSSTEQMPQHETDLYKETHRLLINIFLVVCSVFGVKIVIFALCFGNR